MNTVSITGRLTRDPELRHLAQDTTVCDIRLAVDGMGRSRDVGYINVAVFGKPGEAAARVLGQGWLVAVCGRLHFREWEATDGTKRSAHSIVGDVEFLAAPRSSNGASSDTAPLSTVPEPSDNDDIPF